MTDTELKYGGMSSEAVRANTGKGWEEWLTTLDGENAATLTHKKIAELLSTKYAVPGWWSQMVTVGYEQARGKREVHQKADGYSASVSKTLSAPISALYAACTDETLRAKWIGNKTYTITTATPNKSVRIAWGKGGATRVAFGLYAKGDTKSQLAIQHEKLGSSAEVMQMKTYWGKALEKLASLVEK